MQQYLWTLPGKLAFQEVLVGASYGQGGSWCSVTPPSPAATHTDTHITA